MIRLLNALETILSKLIDWGASAPWRAAVLVTLLAAAVVLPGQTAMPVTDRDEGRFVQASKQMMETGDLVDIRYQEQPRWKKPAGIYWLQSATATVLDGGPEAEVWAYRVPSAIAGILVALLTVWGARPLIGPRGAVLAGLMMAVTLLMVVEAHIAKTDAALALSATTALAALANLIHGKGGWPTALVFWLAIAAGILLKGPIVPVICLLALAWVWVLHRRPPFSKFRPVPGLLLTVLLVAPWLVAIGILSEGAFFQESLGRDMGAKLTSGQEKHWGPPGLYLGIVWGTLWPWAAMLPLAAAWIWAQRRAAWMILLAGWVVPFWLILEIVPTKLPHYVLPLYPALVICLAAWATSTAGENPRWARRVSAVLVVLPVVALAGAVLILPVLLEGAVVWQVLPLAVAALVAGVLAGRAALEGRRLGQVAASILAAAAIYPAVLHFALPSIATAFPSPRMAALIQQYEACASGPAFSVGYHEPSLVFETRTDLRLADPEGAMEALRTDPGALVLLEARWRNILGDGVPPSVVRAEVTYFNYNRGKMQSAELLTPDDARWAACE